MWRASIRPAAHGAVTSGHNRVSGPVAARGHGVACAPGYASGALVAVDVPAGTAPQLSRFQKRLVLRRVEARSSLSDLARPSTSRRPPARSGMTRWTTSSMSVQGDGAALGASRPMSCAEPLTCGRWWRTSSRARSTSPDAIPAMAAGSTAAMRSGQAPGPLSRPPLVVTAEQRRRWGISPIALRGRG